MEYGLRDYGIEGQIWDGIEGCEHEFDSKDAVLLNVNRNGLSGGTVSKRANSPLKVGKQGFCSKCNAWKGQLGQEPIPQLYIQHLMAIMDECKRVLKKTGSCWVNLGDSYFGGGKKSEFSGDWKRPSRIENSKTGIERNCQVCNEPFFGKSNTRFCSIKCVNTLSNLERQSQRIGQHKSLIGIPERFVIAMTDSGWIRRNSVIWFKNNPIPSSALDRFTNDFEYFYFFTKSQKYYFETQYEPYSDITLSQLNQVYNGQASKNYEENLAQNPSDTKRRIIKSLQNGKGRIKRCVWKIPVQPLKEAHFAVFPEALITTPIKACSPPNGIILDPFMGAGTTGVVAKKLRRHYVGIEANSKYIEIAEKRIGKLLESFTSSQTY